MTKRRKRARRRTVTPSFMAALPNPQRRATRSGICGDIPGYSIYSKGSGVLSKWSRTDENGFR